MTDAEIAVLRSRVTTLQFINDQLSNEADKLRLALHELLDVIPPEDRLVYSPIIEHARAALRRLY